MDPVSRCLFLSFLELGLAEVQLYRGALMLLQKVSKINMQFSS